MAARGNLVIALTTPYLWYATRATGIAAMLLFTLVVCLGALVTTRAGGTFIGRFEVNEIHRSISFSAIVFLIIHIVTTILDTFVSTGPISAVVPFTSSYKTLPVSLGTVAFDLIVAVWISSLMKVRIKNVTWRFIHWFSWLAWVTSLVHAYTTGTDARHGIVFVALIASTLAGVAAALWRIFARPARAAGRTALSPLAHAPTQSRKSNPPHFPRVPTAGRPVRPSQRGRR
jgi:predicted ferric reductase